MATLLSIIQDATDEIAVARPTAVISNTDQQIRTLLQMSNREGRDLAKIADWTVLQRLHTITTEEDEAEYALPADYSRLLRETEWDRTDKRPMMGPTSPQEWQSIKSGLIGQGVVDRRFRIYRASTGIGRKVYIDPTPTVDGDTLSFEYISSYWCASAGGTAQAEWAVDTDVPILDADLMTLGLIVRFKRAKGLDFASEADEYQQILSREIGQDRPALVLNLASRGRMRLIGVGNLPESGFGS